MNSFETDLKRAIFSIPFATGVILQFAILYMSDVQSDLFMVSVPVIATFPYSTAWRMDYESGYIKFYVSRVGVSSYIYGKIFACAISGGLVEVAGCYLYKLVKGNAVGDINLMLIFMSGMLWAVVSATMSAWSNSRYVAYGGAFVVCYLLVIMHDRYFEKIYILYPYEWINPTAVWVFGEQGIILLLLGIMMVFVCIYNLLIRRCIERV